MKITWYGHSAFRLDFGSQAVLIDPFFTGNPGFKGDKAEAVRGVTHVLLTHAHADHVGDAPEILQQTGAKLVANYELCVWLASQGVKNFDPMNTGGSTEQDGFRVTLVQAFHSSGEMIDGRMHNVGHPTGIIVTPESGPVVYHLGDTAIFSDMELINELYEPEIGFVPIGDRFTMGPREAAYACTNFFDFDIVVPCHYGSFPIIEPNAERFTALMDAREDTRVVVPEVGVAFEV